ncbi:MAG: hypothetical protein N2691_05905 [Patescibacteria group bacterium]|nr:hypothetical protein [Patescibacteria group bacterium]
MQKRKPTSPVKATTQQFIEIDEIKDDIILMRDRSAVVVIEVGAVNFWLLSQEEQTSIIYAYGGLLNSLSFPVEILILSKKMDISSYLEYLNGKIATSQSEVVKNRLSAYQNFIKNVVKKNTVLEKRFFFIIPFSPLELGAAGISASKMNKEYIISRAKTSLYPKRDHLQRLLAKIGLKATVLHRQELVELFYNLYNPSATGKQLAPVDTYTDVVLSAG